jgi:hypothetical protein
MFSRFQRFLEGLSAYITVWPLLTSSIITSAITGIATSWTGYFRQFAPISWIIGALFGFIIGSIIYLEIAIARYVWKRTSIINRWKEHKTDNVNPLLDEFTRTRILLRDFFIPPTTHAKNKKFIDCELLGPLNILLTGSNYFSRVNFKSCDMAVIHENRAIYNVFILENVTMIGGDVINCTFYVYPAHIDLYTKMGVKFITRTGVKAVDDAPP